MIEENDVGLGRTRPLPILETPFSSIKELCWDHSHSSVKIVVDAPEKKPQVGGKISSSYTYVHIIEMI